MPIANVAIETDSPDSIKYTGIKTNPTAVNKPSAKYRLPNSKYFRRFLLVISIVIFLTFFDYGGSEFKSSNKLK